MGKKKKFDHSQKNLSKYMNKIYKYRKCHPNMKCTICKIPLTIETSIHHKYCNKCWYLYGDNKNKYVF